MNVCCSMYVRAFESHNAIWQPPWQLAREAVLAEEHYCRLLGAAVLRLVGDGVLKDVVLHVVAVVVLVPVLLQADHHPSVGRSLKSKKSRLRDIVQLHTRWSKSHSGLRHFFGPDCCILDDRKFWAHPCCCYQCCPMGLLIRHRAHHRWRHLGCGH